MKTDHKSHHAVLGAEDVERYKRLSRLPDSAIDFSDAPEATDADLARAVRVRGGARPGSGRKPLGHVRVTLSLSPEARRRLVSRAKRERKTMSDLVTGLL